MSPNSFFDSQIALISVALTNNSYLLGDFNLDAHMSDVPEYHRKIPLDKLNKFALDHNLVQLVEECMWSRIINGVLKESLLDHIYVNNPENELTLSYSVPTFGDHKIITVEFNINSPRNENPIFKRDWSKYESRLINDKMHHELSSLNTIYAETLSVNEYWNLFENILI